MSDLVKRLRDGEPCQPDNKCRTMDARSGCFCATCADRIEQLERIVALRDGECQGKAVIIKQLERELAIAEKVATDANDAYSQAHVSMTDSLDQLAAEKALADRLAERLERKSVFTWCDKDDEALAAYRKARGI